MNIASLKQVQKHLIVHPILGGGFENPPALISLSKESPLADEIKEGNQEKLTQIISKIHTLENTNWSLSGDRERRFWLYHRGEIKRRRGDYLHVGVDIQVPVYTVLHTPLKGKIVDIAQDEDEGGYGLAVIIACNEPPFGKFYLLFGHLSSVDLKPKGTMLMAGERFGRVGNLYENGNWFTHTHFQILTEKAYKSGFYQGYIDYKKSLDVDDYFPSPMALILAGINR